MRLHNAVGVFTVCVFTLMVCLSGCDRAASDHVNDTGAVRTATVVDSPAAADTQRAQTPPQAQPTTQSPYLSEARALGEYTDQRGFRRKYVRVAPGLSDAQLTDLGKRLHAQEKNAWLWLLDDDTQAKQMLESLPATERGDLRNYPGKWVEAHAVAHSVMEIVPGGGRRWVLYKGPYTQAQLAVLESEPAP